MAAGDARRPGDCQEPLRQHCQPVHLIAGRLECFTRIAGKQAQLHGQRRDDVANIVRDAGGQRRRGGNPLGLHELRLRLAQLLQCFSQPGLQQVRLNGDAYQRRNRFDLFLLEGDGRQATGDRFRLGS